MSRRNDYNSNQDQDRGRGREHSRGRERSRDVDHGRSASDRSRTRDGRDWPRDDDGRPRGGSYDDRRPRRDSSYDRGSGRGSSFPRRGGHNRQGGGRFSGQNNNYSAYGPRSNQGPDLSSLQACTTNILLANITDVITSMKLTETVASKVVTGDVTAVITEGFHFYEYSINAQNSSGEVIDSRSRRRSLFNAGFWDSLLQALPPNEKNHLRKVVVFNGSTFYSGRQIPGLEVSKLPYEMDFGDKGEGDTMEIVGVRKLLAPEELQLVPRSEQKPNEIRFDNRTADGTMSFQNYQALLHHCQQTGKMPAYVPIDGKPATREEFLAFVNSVLKSALSTELSRVGRDLVIPNDFTLFEKQGVSVYKAVRCEFSILKKQDDETTKTVSEENNGKDMKPPGVLALTIDLAAKIIRDTSILDELVGGRNPMSYNPSESEKKEAKKHFVGQIVITKHDKRCYTVVDLDFGNSAQSLAIPDKGINHAEYFKRKNATLRYPEFKPMVAVLGRGDQTIYLPAELACGTELPRDVKDMLPKIASFPPRVRNEAVEMIRGYLIPGARGGKGVLPGLGIQITDQRFSSRATVLPFPMVMANGVRVPEANKGMWAGFVNRSNYRVEIRDSNIFNVVLICSHHLNVPSALEVYSEIRENVNRLNTCYRLSNEPKIFQAGQREKHWKAVEDCFTGPATSLPKENVLVLDFCKPGGPTDPAYHVIKHMLTRNGYISQFVNFSNCDHEYLVPIKRTQRGDRRKDRAVQRSTDTLNGVGRKILNKAGTRLWWVKIPQGLPTPSVFVGIDVFHAPKEYDPELRRKVRKRSCAAIIVQVFRDGQEQTFELYSETVVREAGTEYGLRDSLNGVVKTALEALDVNPMSCVVWRDGIGDSAFESEASEEINGVEEALKSRNESEKTPMAYIVCQKRINTKLFAKGVDNDQGTLAAPPGTLVEGIQGLQHNTFYINGSVPRNSNSTPKPVRYIIIRQDDELRSVSPQGIQLLPELTWNMCHDYPNWPGPIKVPSVCMMAHKLAELAGQMTDSGASINNKALKNRAHFL